MIYTFEDSHPADIHAIVFQCALLQTLSEKALSDLGYHLSPQALQVLKDAFVTNKTAVSTVTNLKVGDTCSLSYKNMLNIAVHRQSSYTYNLSGKYQPSRRKKGVKDWYLKLNNYGQVIQNPKVFGLLSTKKTFLLGIHLNSLSRNSAHKAIRNSDLDDKTVTLVQEKLATFSSIAQTIVRDEKTYRVKDLENLSARKTKHLAQAVDTLLASYAKHPHLACYDAPGSLRFLCAIFDTAKLKDITARVKNTIFSIIVDRLEANDVVTAVELARVLDGYPLDHFFTAVSQLITQSNREIDNLQYRFWVALRTISQNRSLAPDFFHKIIFVALATDNIDIAISTLQHFTIDHFLYKNSNGQNILQQLSSNTLPLTEMGIDTSILTNEDIEKQSENTIYAIQALVEHLSYYQDDYVAEYLCLPDPQGMSALHHAATSGNQDHINTLLASARTYACYDKSIQSCDLLQQNALRTAFLCRNYAVIPCLMQNMTLQQILYKGADDLTLLRTLESNGDYTGLFQLFENLVAHPEVRSIQNLSSRSEYNPDQRKLLQEINTLFSCLEHPSNISLSREDIKMLYTQAKNICPHCIPLRTSIQRRTHAKILQDALLVNDAKPKKKIFNIAFPFSKSKKKSK